MPRRCSNVFAWMRAVMSQLGPAATTRLVLYAHSMFMNRDGSNCHVGVRRLAEVSGLDKSTVAERRASAIAGGWLMGSKQPAEVPAPICVRRCRTASPSPIITERPVKADKRP